MHDRSVVHPAESLVCSWPLRRGRFGPRSIHDLFSPNWIPCASGKSLEKLIVFVCRRM